MWAIKKKSKVKSVLNQRQSQRREKHERNTYSLPQLPLFPLLYGGEVVHRCVLYHRKEDKDKTDPQVDVHSFDVGDPRHGSIDPGDDGGHGQHGGDAWRESNKV